MKFTAFPSLRKKTFPKKSSSLGKFSTYISPITTSISATEWLHVDLAAIQDQSVRFRSYRAKSELYKARKHLKSASLSNYFHNTEAVYINENLTNYRRHLFAKVRKFKKNNNWHSAWTMDGKIFIKKSQSDQVKRIYEAEDLRNIS